MGKRMKMLIHPMFTIIILIVALFELVLLVRHDVVNNILIGRGLLKREPNERSDYLCIQGWTNTLQKIDYKADVCFIGNSITLNADFHKEFPDKSIINLGYSGDCIEGMIIRKQQISSVSPEKIFLMAGFNDLQYRHLSIEDFKSEYEQLIDSIQSSNPQSELYLESILPVNHQMNSNIVSTAKILEANNVIKQLATQHSLVYIDLFSLYADSHNELPQELTYDGVHLYSSSYTIWSNAISNYINKK